MSVLPCGLAPCPGCCPNCCTASLEARKEERETMKAFDVLLESIETRRVAQLGRGSPEPGRLTSTEAAVSARAEALTERLAVVLLHNFLSVVEEAEKAVAVLPVEEAQGLRRALARLRAKQ